jgi:hypothetical protein
MELLRVLGKAGIFVTLISALYLSFFAYSGWIPHDQGTLAQSAERVLNGELPHRDFDDVYTGGLSFFHAAGFWLLGTNMATIRTLLFVSAIGFVWALHRIASRTMSAMFATLVALTCLVWSLPNYFEGMPSWYTLFLSTSGIFAILKYYDSDLRRWLFLAGLCGGLAVTVKIVGLYYIAAIAFVIAYRGQIRGDSEPTATKGFSWSAFAIAIALNALWIGLVGLMVRRHATFMICIQFILPSLAVGTVLVVNSLRRPTSADGAIRVLREISIYVSGILLPVILFLIPYTTSGSLTDLYQGVFIRPFVRVDAVVFSLPPASYLALEVPVAAVLLLGLTSLGKRDRMISLVVLPLSILGLVLSFNFNVFHLVVTMVRLSLPIVAVIASWMLLFDTNLEDRRKLEIFTVLTVSSFMTLVQFPFSAPIYFCYVAPLVILSAQVTCASQPHAVVRTQWTIVLFGLLFGATLLNHFQFFDDPNLARMDPAVNLLELPRGGLFLTERDRQKYHRLVTAIQQNSPPNSSIYAGPDCPEVYFLSERKNPTRTLFELFDEPDPDDTKRLQFILQHDLSLVVLNLSPSHSRKWTQPFLDAMTAHFPKAMTIDNFLVVFK